MALTPAERQARYRARKRGEDVPKLTGGVPLGYKQTPEHVENRKRFGEDHPAWLGDDVSRKGGRTRALRKYPDIGPCRACGSPRAERHHVDGNTANNEPENIEALCRRCHMAEDGRLDAVLEKPYRGSRTK